MKTSMNEEERSFGQSVVYWGIIYLVTLPVVAVVVGLIVWGTLGSNM